MRGFQRGFPPNPSPYPHQAPAAAFGRNPATEPPPCLQAPRNPRVERPYDSAMNSHTRHLAWIAGITVAASCLLSLGGCVREVISGEDPQVRGPRLSKNAAKNELVVDIPWMQAPTPRMILDDKLVPTEVVYGRSPEKKTLYTLRSMRGTLAGAEVTTNYLPNQVIEFTYRITQLPAGYGMDVVVPISATDNRAEAELTVNGALAKMPPGTEVAVVVLSRDAPTRLVVKPRDPVAPAPAAPAAPATPGASAASAAPAATPAPAKL